MSGFVTDGNEINCHECKYGKNCNVGRGHGYRVGSCIQFEVEKKQTNADRIRAMSDEELADWLIMNGDGSDYETWLEWLKQEAET